ncbi:MAG: 4-alpha-glucanotransferase, partial [Planctomycetales bacterium]|nr:4-alpha-glucanotransferase [Planctomycetales bacterium]
TPESCKPLEERVWGWAVQLYAVRSAASWGIGDLGDLRQLGEWSAKLGARMLQINPLGAATPGLPQATSPYYPSSRRFLNPLYLRIEALPHIERIQSLCDEAGNQARQLNQQRLIDRDAIYRLKMPVLEALWEVVRHDLSNCAYYFSNQGETLQRFATFCVLAERFGQNWRDWPEAYQHPLREEVARFAAENEERVQFHMWLQYLLDRQLQHASEAIPLVFDLPVGVDPGGVDAWCWQDTLALGSRVGAPPDEFNAGGQDWGLPPWIPRKMVAAQYEPFIQTVRASLRYAGGLRIDHVMGLFRLYWIPQGVAATEGTYVDLPSADLLRILALESQ